MSSAHLGSCASSRWLIFPPNGNSDRTLDETHRTHQTLAISRSESHFWRMSDNKQRLVCTRRWRNVSHRRRCFPYHSIIDTQCWFNISTIINQIVILALYTRSLLFPPRRTQSQQRSAVRYSGPNKRERRRKHKKTIVNFWLCVTSWAVHKKKLELLIADTVEIYFSVDAQSWSFFYLRNRFWVCFSLPANLVIVKVTKYRLLESNNTFHPSLWKRKGSSSDYKMITTFWHRKKSGGDVR